MDYGSDFHDGTGLNFFAPSIMSSASWCRTNQYYAGLHVLRVISPSYGRVVDTVGLLIIACRLLRHCFLLPAELPEVLLHDARVFQTPYLIFQVRSNAS